MIFDEECLPRVSVVVGVRVDVCSVFGEIGDCTFECGKLGKRHHPRCTLFAMHTRGAFVRVGSTVPVVLYFLFSPPMWCTC